MAKAIGRWLAPYDAEEPDAARFRSRQLQAIQALTPMSMGINLLNVFIVIVMLWHQLPLPMLLAWAALVCVPTMAAMRGWARYARRATKLHASARAMRRAVLRGSAMGAVWGALPLVAWPHIDLEGRMFLGLVWTGMLCAGGFTLSSIPAASAGYVCMLALGTLIGLLRTSLDAVHLGVATMLLLYSITIIYSARVYGRTLGARLMAEVQSERQKDVIALLLRDFQDNTTDLLWEVDAKGCWVGVSDRLAAALGIPAAGLQGRSAMALMRSLAAREDDGLQRWRELRHRLRQGLPFRDCSIALGPPRLRSWWALNAKPLHDDAGRFMGWRGVASDVTERQLAERRLHWLAHNDTLTGLVNRAQFHESLQRMLALGAASPPLAVVIVDLDGFKQVNDSQGHAVGDALLREAGRRLLGMTRRSDVVARLGGDEFALILCQIGRYEDLEPLMQRMLSAMRQPLVLEGQQISLRASMGAAFAPTDAHEVDQLIRCADEAMYCAKRDGGQRWQPYEASMSAVARRRASIVAALQGAAERGEFRLEFQPQVAADDGRVRGLEALLRWQHPQLGTVSPAEFVPVAESAGLMPDIGLWVLQAACREALHWPPGVSVAINVSATQIGSPSLPAQVGEICSQCGLPAQAVELEITESALISDPDAVVQNLRALRAQGFRVALDDFGTGYSALSYLRHFAFDTLKIDRSFVRDLLRNAEAQVLVDTILAMSKALGMETVAEGVEDPREAAVLRAHGCTALQGYHYSRPMPPEAVLPWLAQWAQQPWPALAPVAADDGGPGTSEGALRAGFSHA